jgi:RNA polymerase-binding protein DksA
MNDYQQLHKTLRQQLAPLQQRLDKIERDLRQTPDPDLEEQALGRENDEVLQQLDNSAREEMRLLQEAIARIETGVYGVCSQCGKQIAPQRLEALPYTTTCISCAG